VLSVKEREGRYTIYFGVDRESKGEAFLLWGSRTGQVRGGADDVEMMSGGKGLQKRTGLILGKEMLGGGRAKESYPSGEGPSGGLTGKISLEKSDRRISPPDWIPKSVGGVPLHPKKGQGGDDARQKRRPRDFTVARWGKRGLKKALYIGNLERRGCGGIGLLRAKTSRLEKMEKKKRDISFCKRKGLGKEKGSPSVKGGGGGGWDFITIEEVELIGFGGKTIHDLNEKGLSTNILERKEKAFFFERKKRKGDARIPPGPEEGKKSELRHKSARTAREEISRGEKIILFS